MCWGRGARRGSSRAPTGRQGVVTLVALVTADVEVLHAVDAEVREDPATALDRTWNVPPEWTSLQLRAATNEVDSGSRRHREVLVKDREPAGGEHVAHQRVQEADVGHVVTVARAEHDSIERTEARAVL